MAKIEPEGLQGRRGGRWLLRLEVEVHLYFVRAGSCFQEQYEPAREIREVENAALKADPFFTMCLVALRH